MLRAARGVADAVERLAGGRVGEGPVGVVALAGGGDNGGDALYAAAMLARDGLEVRAALLSDHPHARALAEAQAAGVDVRRLPLPLDEGVPGWLTADLWVDGLTGTGLRGPLREPLAAAVRELGRAARLAGTRIVAVDVPSGSGAEDGTVPGAVLPADHTVTMGAVKTPLLLPPAAQYAGSVETVDLGLDAGAHGEGAPSAEVLRPEASDVALMLRVPGPFDHKYTRGVVTVAAGSDTYPGAGVLAVMGALGAGPGMVRLESSGRTSRIVLDRHPGVVTASGRSQAAVVGSGLDSEIEHRALSVARRALGRGIPLVLDAGALGFVSALRTDPGPLAGVVLTPHAGEAATLLAELEDRPVERDDVEARPLAGARRLAELTGATVVLKGSVTLVVGADGRVFSLEGTTGWAGVAGSGDVLAGVMGSLLAQRRAEEERGGDPLDVALTAACAVWIHAEAARLAAGADPAGPAQALGAPIQADELASAVPAVIGGLVRVAQEERRTRRRRTWAQTRDEAPSAPAARL